MKTIWALFLLIMATSVSATNVISIKGPAARFIMEAFSAAGLPIKNSESEWSGKILTLKTGPITCHYNAIFPDDWMTNVTCVNEAEGEQTLKQSMGIAKSIYPYAYIESGLGNRWVRVEALDCSLIYDLKDYHCKIENLNDE